MSEATTLYIWAREQIAVDAAVGAVKFLPTDNPIIGLFYSPRWCRFAWYRDGSFKDENDVPLDFTYVFEARVFGEPGELRWWNDPASGFRRGKATFVSEINRAPDGWTDSPIVRKDVVRCSNQYLLWGEGWKPRKRSPVAGWSCLATGRIGTLMVPFLDLGPKERLHLTTFEYFGLDLGEAGNHGNVAVVEERLVKLEKYEHPQEQEKDGTQQKEESHD